MRGPGGIAGLLETASSTTTARTDIYRLADELAFEIDDLLPIVEAAQLLGFLKVEEGDAAITPEGREYAESEILKQKELFRKAALDHVLLLRQISRALANKSDHSVSGGVLPRHAGRAVQRRRVHAAAGDGDQLGPVRGVVRLGRCAAALHAARA